MPGERPFRVLVAGASVAGLEVVLALRDLAESLVEIEVLAPEGEFVYRPLAVAEPFGAGEVYRFPLADLLTPSGARHRRDALAAVEPNERRVTTMAGEVLDYTALVIACGARPKEAFPGSLTFHGTEDRYALRAALDAAAAGRLGSIVFAVPGGVVWPLPLYELALMTAVFLRGRRGAVELTIVTPERAPLALFGQAASDAVSVLLAERDIAVVPGTYPVEIRDGVLRTTSGRELPADRVVSLPRLEGPGCPGCRRTARASSRRPSSAPCEGPRASTRPGTRSPSRSSRAGSPRSRPTS
jgi:sulfide:quinone oxidoreductase